MIDALFEFVQFIKDFVLSLIDGLMTFGESLWQIYEVNASAAIWMPGYLVSVMMMAMVLIIVLRLIGR